MGFFRQEYWSGVPLPSPSYKVEGPQNSVYGMEKPCGWRSQHTSVTCQVLVVEEVEGTIYSSFSDTKKRPQLSRRGASLVAQLVKNLPSNAGYSGLIPGSGKSPGERMGYLFQFSWVSLVSQMVKNLPAIWETWVWSLGWEDPLQEVMATPPVFLPGESPGTDEPGGLESMGLQRVGHNWVTKHCTAHPESISELFDYYQ